MRWALSLLSCVALGGVASCSADPQASGITGVYDATQALQAGNTAIVRYWFTSDGKWGRVKRQIIGSTADDTCASTADATYELKGDKVYLRDGARTEERTWALLENNTLLKLDPGDTFINGTLATTFKRASTAQTTRTCNTAFQ
ncbi:MAG: hypothetical protein JST00_01170 [Deltaproteobacteria bacterium]|nr:hypothetical protein [Deltaproteobacteria bacterium]